MRTSELVAATPATRDRYVDFLRAAAIVSVVVGHWLAVMVTYDGVRLGGQHVLTVLPWTHWLTWLFQVMGMFFVVGGYANAASWDSARRRGMGYADWLSARATRLLRPTTVFVVVGVTVAAVARIAGQDPGTVRLGAWLVAISLWFLAVYLVIVALAPVMLAAHRRGGLGVPALLAAVAAGFDALRLGAGVGHLGLANFLIVWLILPQLGFAWRDGTLTRSALRPWLLFLGGLAALVGLTTIGPYPVSMIGVPGAEVQNTSPPTVALLALTATHLGLALLLAAPLRRWLRRRRVWTAVVAINGVIMTLYLWHMVPVLVAALTLYPTGLMPQPPIGSASWFAWRPVWVAVCAALLGVLVAVFSRVERPRDTVSTTGPPRATTPTRPGSGRLANAWVLVGTAAACAGVVQFTVGGFQGTGPAGVPVMALVTYLTGVGAIAMARRVAPRPPEPATSVRT